jgi:hypothetical protein
MITDGHAAFAYRNGNVASKKPKRATARAMITRSPPKSPEQQGAPFMDRCIPDLTVGSVLGVAAAAAMMFIIVLQSGALAQTLTDPNPPARWSPPHQAAAKSPSTATAKPCTGYGAGFVQVPGTDTCIKIGGWVSMEGSTSR